jgi:hypothetical protein
LDQSHLLHQYSLSDPSRPLRQLGLPLQWDLLHPWHLARLSDLLRQCYQSVLARQSHLARQWDQSHQWRLSDPLHLWDPYYP